MSERIDLGSGQWLKLADDLTMAAIEKISAASTVWDPAVGQWRPDAYHAAIEMVPLLVEEWALSSGLPPTADSLRATPIKLGMRIQRVLNKRMLELQQEAESDNFPDASES